jgi:glycosyltransferase involved in cell wall biosynthesis
LKISIITVCYNGGKTIEKTIQSVLSQTYENIEYIIIDGMSKDNTLEIINRYRHKISTLVSEKDNGMYDALNKGVKLATGDIVGILNADDVFASNNILFDIGNFFKNSDVDAVIADVAFINKWGKIIRSYSSRYWNPGKFVWGFMPPHPSFYCKRELFSTLGYYRSDFQIAADYELLIRFINKNKIKYTYLPLLMVLMNTGGKSTNGIKSNIVINKEIKYACELNGLNTNYFKLYSKYFIKIFEFLK